MNSTRGPGRFDPLQSADVPDEGTRGLLERLERSGNVVLMARMVANSTTVFKPYLSMSNALLHRAALPARPRELAILQLARGQQVQYEWYEHARMALSGGVSTAEVDAIRTGRIREQLSAPADVFVVEAVDEWLASGGCLTPRTWASGVEVLGPAEMLEFAFVLAWWGAWVPAVVKLLEISPPDDGSSPLERRLEA